MVDFIEIKGAKEHNLKGFDIKIPHNKLTVVTGLSGSGKSSLIHDIIYRESSRRYFSSYSSYARHYLGKMGNAKAESIMGLTPAISLNQAASYFSSSSTVGTLTELTDILRLMFARAGDFPLDFEGKKRKSLFSFNSAEGMCPGCRGIGKVERISLNTLITDPSRSIRERVFSITTSNGYIMYSQVTLDVLNRVCEVHGFNIDIPWNQLKEDEKNVVLYGSDKIKIPFGKHTLESRMKWTGITAKPRDEGFYKGIIPVMEDILKRDRNKNILKYVESVECGTCSGTRLNDKARSVVFYGRHIAEYCGMTVGELDRTFRKLILHEKSLSFTELLINSLLNRTELLIKLGLSHLTLSRESSSLSGGEVRRSKMAALGLSDMRGVTYILDEPSVGLHPVDIKSLIDILRRLRNKGNTVIVVEHEHSIIQHADWIVDIGPGAGANGGELIYSGPAYDFFKKHISRSITAELLKNPPEIKTSVVRCLENIFLCELNANNLKDLSVTLKKSALNVITGVSGAGKSTFVKEMRSRFEKGLLTGVDSFLFIDQSPIGKTSRSNPATYIKLFDRIRDFFAGLPEAEAADLTKSDFSFNVTGGRCETCQGAGIQTIGMHFMDNIDIVCDHCNGRRFGQKVLSVKYNDRNIADVLDMSVEEALCFFKDEKKITHYLAVLKDIGLSYITLGQSSSTLSGGEAQRVKLAASLVRPFKGNTMIVFDEPTTGLHKADVNVLLSIMKRLCHQDITVLAVEHDSDIISGCDWIVELGPGSGPDGGELIVAGTPEEILSQKCLTADILKGVYSEPESIGEFQGVKKVLDDPIRLKKITTHNLKGIDVDFPINTMTVVSGVSGAGKSSLLLDTLFSEAQDRFSEGLSSYVRSFLRNARRGELESVQGLVPVALIERAKGKGTPRSTAGTLTGIYDLMRLLYSRSGTRICPECGCNLKKHTCHKCGFEGTDPLTSSMFSFNSEHGACECCRGLGYTLETDPESLITAKHLSFFDGAINGTKTGRFYGDPAGQYIAVLRAVGNANGIDFSVPVDRLDRRAFDLAFYGSGDKEYEVQWEFKRKSRKGKHQFTSRWIGFAGLIKEEYTRKHKDSRVESLLLLMMEKECPVCKGSRLNRESSAVTFRGLTIGELSNMSVKKMGLFFRDIIQSGEYRLYMHLINDVLHRLNLLDRVGLSYINLSRSTSSVSGGELQRLKLVNQVISGLHCMMFVFDEPGSGLHMKDREKVLSVINELIHNNNTIAIAEHSREFISEADRIIELGPSGGDAGGEKIFEGTLSEALHFKDSQTGRFLRNLIRLDVPIPVYDVGLTLKDICCHNLNIDYLEIPSGCLIAVTGVSGSGKSSLMFDVIWESFKSKKPTGCKDITGFNRFKDVVAVSRISSSNTPLSSPATITGIMDLIKSEFSKTDDALGYGLKSRAFSSSSKEGACPQCKGLGSIKCSLDFMGDVWKECEHCEGQRFVGEVALCRLNGKTIFEVLEMSADEALHFFSYHEKINMKLTVLKKMGLGYLKLGQPANTLSHGERGRLKLACEIIKPRGGHTLFILDEPSDGLFFTDQEKLLKLFSELVQEGHTIIMIEHSPDMIINAHHVIDLGPGSGEDGGSVVAQCTPDELIEIKKSVTCKCIRKWVQKSDS